MSFTHIRPRTHTHQRLSGEQGEGGSGPTLGAAPRKGGRFYPPCESTEDRSVSQIPLGSLATLSEPLLISVPAVEKEGALRVSLTPPTHPLPGLRGCSQLGSLRGEPPLETHGCHLASPRLHCSPARAGYTGPGGASRTLSRPLQAPLLVSRLRFAILCILSSLTRLTRSLLRPSLLPPASSEASLLSFPPTSECRCSYHT